MLHSCIPNWTIIVAGSLLLCLAVAEIGVMSVVQSYDYRNTTEVTQDTTRSQTYSVGWLQALQFGVGGWYLIASILAIVAAKKDRRKLYIAVIVFSMLGVFISIAGAAVAAVGFVNTMFGNGVSSDTTYSHTEMRSSLFDSAAAIEVYASWLTGVMILHIFGFLLFTTISFLSCYSAYK